MWTWATPQKHAEFRETADRDVGRVRGCRRLNGLWCIRGRRGFLRCGEADRAAESQHECRASDAAHNHVRRSHLSFHGIPLGDSPRVATKRSKGCTIDIRFGQRLLRRCECGSCGFPRLWIRDADAYATMLRRAAAEIGRSSRVPAGPPSASRSPRRRDLVDRHQPAIAGTRTLSGDGLDAFGGHRRRQHVAAAWRRSDRRYAIPARAGSGARRHHGRGFSVVCLCVRDEVFRPPCQRVSRARRDRPTAMAGIRTVRCRARGVDRAVCTSGGDSPGDRGDPRVSPQGRLCRTNCLAYFSKTLRAESINRRCRPLRMPQRW